MKLTQAVLLVLAVSFPGDLLGQEPRASVFGTLKPGQIVRVRPRTGDRIESRVLSIQGDSLVLSSEGSSVVLGTPVIDSLWVKGQATATGAIVGTSLAAVGSVVVSAAVCKSIREDFPCGESGKAIAASIAGGAALGAVIGSVVPKWRLRYARTPGMGVGRAIQSQFSLAIVVTLP